MRRVPEAHWPKHSKALIEVLDRANYKRLADQNGFFEDGYFPVTISNADELSQDAVVIGLSKWESLSQSAPAEFAPTPPTEPWWRTSTTTTCKPN